MTWIRALGDKTISSDFCTLYEMSDCIDKEQTDLIFLSWYHLLVFPLSSLRQTTKPKEQEKSRILSRNIGKEKKEGKKKREKNG